MVFLLAERLELVERHHLNPFSCIPDLLEVRALCIVGVVIHDDLDRGRVCDDGSQCAQEVAVGEDADDLGLIE